MTEYPCSDDNSEQASNPLKAIVEENAELAMDSHGVLCDHATQFSVDLATA